MSIPAEMYTFGTQYFIMVPTMILIVLVCNYIYVPVFYNNQIANCYEVKGYTQLFVRLNENHFSSSSPISVP